MGVEFVLVDIANLVVAGAVFGRKCEYKGSSSCRKADRHRYSAFRR